MFRCGNWCYGNITLGELEYSSLTYPESSRPYKGNRTGSTSTATLSSVPLGKFI